jgi:pyruvate dehydrogenase (quinone)
MQMNGINELITIAKYWRQWNDPRLCVLVLHNNDLNQVTWEQRAMEGDPKFEGSQDVPDFDYAAFAEMVGLKGIHMETVDAVGPAWDEALAANRPVVVDARTDPNVPPIPPHIEFKQAKNLMFAVGKGDTDTKGIIRQGIKDKIEDLIPRSSS